jgi:hypothetical protein
METAIFDGISVENRILLRRLLNQVLENMAEKTS